MRAKLYKSLDNILFESANNLSIKFIPLSKDLAVDIMSSLDKKYPKNFNTKVIAQNPFKSGNDYNYGFELKVSEGHGSQYYILPLGQNSFKKSFNAEDNPDRFPINFKDQNFVLIDYDRNLICIFATSTSGGFSGSRSISRFQYLDSKLPSENKILYAKIFAEFINIIKMAPNVYGFDVDENNRDIDDEFIKRLTQEGFEKKGSYYIKEIKKPKKAIVPNKSQSIAPDNKKNDSKSGSRDWEQKSSGRKDGMPGGNKSSDYITKGDHGQTGHDIFFKGIDKAADYIFNKEASKKYRV